MISLFGYKITFVLPINKLAAQSRALLEKITIAQLFRKFPVTVMKLEFLYRVHMSPPLAHMLNQMNRILAVPHYVLKIHVKSILLPKLTPPIQRFIFRISYYVLCVHT
jgi:hypothetical protein